MNKKFIVEKNFNESYNKGYRVILNGFIDSCHENKHAAQVRADFLNFIEPIFENEKTKNLFYELWHDENLNIEIITMHNPFDYFPCPNVFWNGAESIKVTQTIEDFISLLYHIKESKD